ncbi:MAG: DMT family transporter [Paracoccaceae bacterium]
MPQPDTVNVPPDVTAATGERAGATDNPRAIGWILASVVAASAMVVAVRMLSADISSPVIVLLRAALTIMLLAPVLALSGRARRQLRFSRPWLHVLRGGLIGIATNLGFYTLTRIPLATASVLFFMAPVFATILAIPVHGEKVGPRRWAAVGCGFLGAVIILRPDTGSLHPAMIAALGSSLTFAAALTLSRGLAIADGAFSGYFSAVVITALLTLPFALPSLGLPASGIGLVSVGVLVAGGAVRGVADIQAYRLGEASVLAPIIYLRLVLIGLAGYLFFGETPDAPTLAGAAIIILATLYIARRETRAGKAENRRG